MGHKYSNNWIEVGLYLTILNITFQKMIATTIYYDPMNQLEATVVVATSLIAIASYPVLGFFSLMSLIAAIFGDQKVQWLAPALKKLFRC